MTLKELIDFTDGIKPNAYTTAQKTVWINEVEGLVQTEVLLLAVTEVYGHLYSSTQTVTVAFPDDKTAVFAAKPDVRLYGYLTFSDFAVNNLTAKILGISADGLTLTFAASTFTPEAVAEEGTAVYDGSAVELLVPAPHSKIYYAYLCAMIDFANGEYNKYQKEMQLVYHISRANT